jgi:hypothetical protein
MAKQTNPWQYHTPNEAQLKVMTEFRTAFESLAKLIESSVPDCRQRSLAITKLEEAAGWANKASLQIE